MPVVTYYFDGSDAGASDPNGVWTDDANAFDGNTATFATTGDNTGSVSTNYLFAAGTDAPSSIDEITLVRARVHYNDNGGAGVWSSYRTIPAPTGGWTFSVLQSLEIKIYWLFDGGGGDEVYLAIYTDSLGELLDNNLYAGVGAGGSEGVAKVELEVTYNIVPVPVSAPWLTA